MNEQKAITMEIKQEKHDLIKIKGKYWKLILSGLKHGPTYLRPS